MTAREHAAGHVGCRGAVTAAGTTPRRAQPRAVGQAGGRRTRRSASGTGPGTSTTPGSSAWARDSATRVRQCCSHATGARHHAGLQLPSHLGASATSTSTRRALVWGAQACHTPHWRYTSSSSPLSVTRRLTHARPRGCRTALHWACTGSSQTPAGCHVALRRHHTPPRHRGQPRRRADTHTAPDPRCTRQRRLHTGPRHARHSARGTRTQQGEEHCATRRWSSSISGSSSGSGTGVGQVGDAAVRSGARSQRQGGRRSGRQHSAR